MGGKCPHRKVKKRRLSHKSARRTKFELKGDDAVYQDLKKLSEGDGPKPLPRDEDLPGMGQYYCMHCDRYFQNVTVRDDHFKTKKHKKRLKIIAGPAPHTQLDADLAAGMGMPDNDCLDGTAPVWFLAKELCDVVSLSIHDGSHPRKKPREVLSDLDHLYPLHLSIAVSHVTSLKHVLAGYQQPHKSNPLLFIPSHLLA